MKEKSRNFARIYKMVIGVSACLLGENCKYSGGNNYNEKVIEYIKGHEVVSICPEVLGGLPIPRDPAEIVDGVVKHKDGSSVDKEFRDGAKKALEILKDKGADLVILQSRSPSCGVNTIYDGTFSGKLISGNGVFVELLKAEGFNVIDVEEL